MTETRYPLDHVMPIQSRSIPGRLWSARGNESMRTACIQIDRLGSTEETTYDAWAQYEIQDYDVAGSIARRLLTQYPEPMLDNEGEDIARYTIVDKDELEAQMMECGALEVPE